MNNAFDDFIFDSEEADEIYIDSQNDEYWKDISDKFPRYNFVDTQDHIDAVEYILTRMKNEYDNIDWDEIESEMRNKISDGLS